jgi:hypothetical protein
MINILIAIGLILFICIIYYNRKKFPDWFRDGFESFIWNSIGNLMSIYVMVFIVISEKGFDFNQIYKAIHQPYTYLILSGAYMANSYYLITKRGNKKNRIFPIIFAISLLFIGLLIKDKTSLENLTANFYKELTVIIIFSMSLIFYIYFEFKNHYDIYNPEPNNEVNDNYNNLEEQFDQLPQ